MNDQTWRVFSFQVDVVEITYVIVGGISFSVGAFYTFVSVFSFTAALFASS